MCLGTAVQLSHGSPVLSLHGSEGSGPARLPFPTQQSHLGATQLSSVLCQALQILLHVPHSHSVPSHGLATSYSPLSGQQEG